MCSKNIEQEKETVLIETLEGLHSLVWLGCIVWDVYQGYRGVLVGLYDFTKGIVKGRFCM